MRYDAKDIKIIRKVIAIVQFVSIVILPEYILNLSLLSLIYEKDGIVLKKTSSPEFFKKEGINLLVGDFPKNSNDLLLSYEAYNTLKGVKVGSKINVGVMLDENGSVIQSSTFNVVGIIKVWLFKPLYISWVVKVMFLTFETS